MVTQSAPMTRRIFNKTAETVSGTDFRETVPGTVPVHARPGHFPSRPAFAPANVHNRAHGN
jgi:hypothetical protein